MLRFRLRTLMILMAIGSPLLAYAWLGREWALLAICGVLFSGFFAFWYWMLLKSQAMDPRTRGGDKWNQM
jgi:hypothetical protein